MIELVDPKSIPICGFVYPRDVKYQINRLQREGQIEPIKLNEDGTADLDDFVYNEAIITAAIALGWETILVTKGG
jgi:hypothetical protein